MKAHPKHPAALLAVLAVVVLQSAHGAGGRYEVEGGTPSERAQVAAALNASSFDWDVVPARIQIHIARGLGSGSALLSTTSASSRSPIRS